MVFKARKFVEVPPPYPCFFKCGNELHTKLDSRCFQGWEWFTGYGAHPLHFCPKCRRGRRFEIDRIREYMGKRPPGYPNERVEPPFNTPEKT